jgi:hypothetical protein
MIMTECSAFEPVKVRKKTAQKSKKYTQEAIFERFCAFFNTHTAVT